MSKSGTGGRLTPAQEQFIVQATGCFLDRPEAIAVMASFDRVHTKDVDVSVHSTPAHALLLTGMVAAILEGVARGLHGSPEPADKVALHGVKGALQALEEIVSVTRVPAGSAVQ